MLKKLSCLNGVSGREDAVRDCILDEISSLADELRVDANGSVIALKKGRRTPENRLMIAAHMDEPGLMVTSVTEDGLLRFTAVGGLESRVLCGKSVTVGDNRVPGVIGAVPVHLITSEERGKYPKLENLCIDIGAENRAQALEFVSPGDCAALDTVFEPIGDGMLKGKALDDRAGCAVLIELMKQELPCDVWFAFTAMDEVGSRGAGCAAYTVEPDIAVVVDGVTAADIGGVDEDDSVCSVGSGAVISFMDKRTIYDRELYSRALDIARDKGVTLQVSRSVVGGNGAGAIQRSRNGVRTLSVGFPCRYSNSPASLVSELDLISVYELVSELIAENK